MIEFQAFRTISQQVDIDATASKDDRIALNGFHLLQMLFFSKDKFVFAASCDETVKVRTYRHASLLMCNQLQVNTQMRVWEEFFEKLFRFIFRFSFVFTISKS